MIFQITLFNNYDTVFSESHIITSTNSERENGNV